MKALAIAKYILSLVDEEKGQIISNLALQKLLYYCQGYYLAYTQGKERLFEEDLIAWKYGPVVPDVYYYYKNKVEKCSALPINEITDDIIQNITKNQKNVIETVFEYFKGYSAIALMEQTHQEAPWKTTLLSDVISTDKIYKFFENKIIE